MPNQQKLTKEQLVKIIEDLEKNPNDRIGILADIGITTLGAAGAGAAAAVFGTTTASIPIVTALTGLGMAVAAPVTLVAGAAVAGGAAIYGISRLIKDSGFHEGKQSQLLNECKEKLREIEAKEQGSSTNENDKMEFYSFLKEPLRQELISPDDAQNLMQAIENGHISLHDAYGFIRQILSSNSTTTQFEKVVTACPNCSQRLRAPNNLGKLNLTCPKCNHNWSWMP